MRIIAAYPRSGSTWLRFILANLLDDTVVHTFDSVNKLIPDMDNLEGMEVASPFRQFYKTHNVQFGGNVIHVHRHVGDVLISEWWYKKKFHNEQRTLEQYLHDDDYGCGWRDFVRNYYGHHKAISYDNLGNANVLCVLLLPQVFSTPSLQLAIHRSTADEMRKAEEHGFGIYPSGDSSIKFVREARSGQWKELDALTQSIIIEKNYLPLRILGYL